VVTVLNEIYETDFKGFSYGFRPGLNAHEALDALNAGLQKKRVNWISLFYRECRFCVRKSPVLPPDRDRVFELEFFGARNDFFHR
jgi:hypothetical protein